MRLLKKDLTSRGSIKHALSLTGFYTTLQPNRGRLERVNIERLITPYDLL